MCLAYSSRCSGDSAAIDSSSAPSASRHMSVSVCAGSTSTTLIPHGRSSMRSASAIPSSANFDAL